MTWYELKGVPQPPKRSRGGKFRQKKAGPKFDKRKAGKGPRPSRKKFGPKYKPKLAGLGPRGRKFGPRFNRKLAGLGPRGRKFGPRYIPRLAGLGPKQKPAPLGRRRRGGSRIRYGASPFSRWMRRLLAKAGLRRPTLASLFRKKSVGDGRNHGYTGVKKRGRTGLSGR